MKTLGILLGLFASVAMSAPVQERTADDVQQQINQEKSQELVAKQNIGALEAEIAQLRTKVDLAHSNNATLTRQLFAKAGVTPSELDAYLQQLSAFTTQVNAFQSQYVSVPKDWETAVVWAEYQMNSVWKANPAARLHQTDTLLALAGQAVTSSRTALETVKAKIKSDSLAMHAQQEKAHQDSLDAIQLAKQSKAEKGKKALLSEPAKSVQTPSASIPINNNVVRKAIPEKSSFDGKTYQVGRFSEHKDGSLWDISAIVYGDPYKWQRLWRANRDQIKDPDHVSPGSVLIVPPGYVPR